MRKEALIRRRLIDGDSGIGRSTPDNPNMAQGVKDRNAIPAKLRENESALREAGRRTRRPVRISRPRSYIDILIEVAPMSLWDYVGVTQFIEDLFAEPVDVADRSRLKSFVRPSGEREAIYAF